LFAFFFVVRPVFFVLFDRKFFFFSCILLFSGTVSGLNIGQYGLFFYVIYLAVERRAKEMRQLVIKI